MAVVFLSRPYGRFTEIKSNLRKMKAPIFLKTVLAIETVTTLRERQSQYLKRYFFLKKRPIHFHINSTRVIRPAKQNNLRFSSVEINKPLDAPVCSVLQIRFQLEDYLVVATNQMPDHNQNKVQYHQIDRNITDNIIRKVINV